MPTLLTKINSTPDGRKFVKYDLGRNAVVAIVGVVSLVLAVVLWVTDHNAPAQAIFSLGEAVVVGGIGLAQGEKRGALAAGAETDTSGP